MKFDKHIYWKHKDCKNAFICRTKTVFDEDGKNAILSVTWCVQGTSNWWFTPANGRITIKPEQYDKWFPYMPHEDML